MPESRLYEVYWSAIAEKDLVQIVEFIETEQPERAQELWRRIKKKSESLERFPLRGRLVPELKVIGLDIYRELIIAPYRLLFRMKGRHVLVLGFFDGRRDMEEVLFDRLTHL